jgi:hypothetical protein
VTTPDNTGPAGWYADPSGQPGHRWWDGNTWHPRTDEAASLAHKWLTTTGGMRLVLASWWRRAAGLLIDGVIVYAVTVAVQMAVGLIFSSGPLAFGLYGHRATLSPTARVILTILIAGGNLVYAAMFLGRWGQTLGMMAVHARALDLQSGKALAQSKAWLRQLTCLSLSHHLGRRGILDGCLHSPLEKESARHPHRICRDHYDLGHLSLAIG